MIIDSSYFVNKLNLPQVGNTEGEADVNNFISQYEKEYLQCVLGYDLWKVFIAGSDGSGLPTEQRWIDLLEGAEFVYKGCTYEWPGFKPVPPALKISPIAYYVFYQYVDNKVSDFTIVGNVVSTTDNNRTVNPVDRLVDTWNRMVDLNKLLYKFLSANKASYPEWKVCSDSCGCGCNCGSSCDCDTYDYASKNCIHLFKKINQHSL